LDQLLLGQSIRGQWSDRVAVGVGFSVFFLCWLFLLKVFGLSSWQTFTTLRI